MSDPKERVWSSLGQQRVNLFLLIFSFLLLNACTATIEPQATEQPTVAARDVELEAPTLEPTDTPVDEVIETQELTLMQVHFGVNAAFEPFVFKDEQGVIVGFDIDLLNALSQAGNFEFAYSDLPFEELLSEVELGELDAAISAITATEERAQRVNFSDVYFHSGQAPVSYLSPGQGLAVHVDETTISNKDSLTASVTVGVKADTTGAAFVAEETEAEAVTFPEAADALHALSDETVDAVVVDIPVIVRFIQNNPDASIRISGAPLTDEFYAIAVNPARTDLLERINTALATIQADGRYEQIFEKWFGSP